MSRYYKVKQMAKRPEPDFAKGDKIEAICSGFDAMYRAGDTAVVTHYLGSDGGYGQAYKVKHQDGRELTIIGRNWRKVETAGTTLVTV